MTLAIEPGIVRAVAQSEEIVTLGKRTPGIDAWRAVLMLGGILLHATILKEDRHLFSFLDVVSSSFRMGAFFFLSGLLTGHVLQKREPKVWFKRRLIRLGVPALFGLTIICPALNLLIGHFLGPIFPLFSVHHFWFLIALLFYTSLIYLAEDTHRRVTFVSRMTNRLARTPNAGLLLILGTGCFSFISSVVLAMITGHSSPVPAHQIFGDAPLFLMGYLLARSSPFHSLFSGGSVTSILILSSVAAVYALWYIWFGNAFDRHSLHQVEFFIRTVGASFCAPAASILIWRSALRITSIPPFLFRLSDASFTIYVVHYPILVVINLIFRSIDWNPYLEYLIAVLLGGVVSYAIHEFIVRRSALAALLLNGVLPKRGRPLLESTLA